HTVPLLASFEHVDPITKKTEYYMLFPCADGSLFDYWFTQKAKHSAKNKEHVKLMINQFIGLLKALDSFHQLSFKIEGGSPAPRHARHCDVKPANIFAFKNGLGDKTTPIFVLGDFGSVRFGGDKAIGDMSFRAPESQLKGVKESTKADIFSLGCCLLEYVTWLLKDNKAVEHFSDIRVEKDILGSTNDSFFTVDKTATIPTLKKSVTAWLNDLLKHPDCTPALREILNITEQNMMNPVAQTRLDAKQVITKLETTLKKI
ncbi:kinase-like domain-containing protein, partial [Podospora fimiseda]